MRPGPQARGTRYPERWFPPLAAQILNFAKNGSLVPTEDFERTTLRFAGALLRLADT